MFIYVVLFLPHSILVMCIDILHLWYYTLSLHEQQAAERKGKKNNIHHILISSSITLYSFLFLGILLNFCLTLPINLANTGKNCLSAR